MEELDIDGLFWPEEEPENQLAGRLRFDIQNGARLSLIGGFGGIEQFGTIPEPRCIHGVAGKRLLTLADCRQDGQSLEMPGIARERYSVPAVLSGGHLPVRMLDGFTSVSVKLHHLERWVNQTGTTVQYNSSEEGRSRSRFVLNFEPLETVAIEMGQFTLELRFPWQFTPDLFDPTIRQFAAIAVQFDDPVSLEEAIVPCAAIQDLVTIGLDTPAVITQVSLTHSEVERKMTDGRILLDPIELYARFRIGQISQDEGKPHTATMLFTFDHIGGLDGVAKWLGVARTFSPVVGTLLAHQYLPSIHIENRFLNAVVALEALERIRAQKQQVILKAALHHAVESAGTIGSDLVGCLDTWASEVQKMRVLNVVHRGLHEDIDYPRMYELSESIYILVIINLLQECGVRQSMLSNIQGHDRYRRVADGLAR